MKKKSVTQAIVTEISGSLSVTLKMMAENSGAVLADMKLMVFVLSNTRCSRKTRLGTSHLRPRGLDLPGHISWMILN